MKKILMFSIILGVMLMSVGLVVAGNQAQENVCNDVEGEELPPFSEGPNAERCNRMSELAPNGPYGIEVAPGVFYLGNKVEKGQVVEGYAFVHYAKGKDSSKAKPTWDDSDRYKFLFAQLRLKWYGDMTYEVEIANSELLEEDVEGILQKSLQTWNDAIGDESTQFGLGTSNNKITWGVLPYDNAIAMNTITYNRLTGQIVDSDVTFSTGFTWGVDGESDKMDLQNIATHEFGHNGLADLYNRPARPLTMFGYSDFGETSKRDLATGDKLGIQALYGI